jgi:multidrug efflux pump subunit AcrB
MVKFLIYRPIAVCITFLALMFMGLVAFEKLPVSLLPDVPIPVITVQTENSELGVQEMENIVTARLRRYLMQCNSLKDIQSVSRDGSSVITLQFEYGINTAVAAIDVSEKIDRAMNSLPEGTVRPRVFKASATDIPVFYLNLYYKDAASENDMVVLSEYAGNVVRRRLEQLPEVAMVDITGTVAPRITIRPRPEKNASIGLEPHDFEKAFTDNNIEMGSVRVNEGYYTYSVRLSNKQWGIGELKLLPINIGERVFTMGELAEINVDEGEKTGMFLTGRQPGISLAVIKQSDAKVARLKENIEKALGQLRKENPRIMIGIERDQMALLDYSIRGLRQNLMVGAILAFLIVFAFMADIRLPLIMGLILPVSIVISFLFFMLSDISLNIISLSGIILAIGMMIDNSIIVIDNITQFRERGNEIGNATVGGTNEVIRPLLSSALTTCAVFIPLVFLSGMSGALFLDQAITVSIGLGVSFWVSITLLPTLYFMFFKKTGKSGARRRFVRKELIPLNGFYSKSFHYVFKNKAVFLAAFIACIVAALPLYNHMVKESFPLLTQNEATVKIEWNENINIETNRERTLHIIDNILDGKNRVDSWIGMPQYILVRDFTEGSNVTHLWLKSEEKQELEKAIEKIQNQVSENYPVADFTRLAGSNVFEKTFLSNGPDFEMRVYDEGVGHHDLFVNRQVRDTIKAYLGKTPINKLKENDFVLLRYDAVKLSLYGIAPNRLLNVLWAKLKNHPIGFYNAFNQQIPVVISEDSKTLEKVIGEETIKDRDGRDIPLKTFLKAEKTTQPYQLTASAEGKYISLEYLPDKRQLAKTEKELSQIMKNHFPLLKFDFKGQVYENKKLIKEMMVVLLISVILLYFILAAQFESLTQPLIVLLEIPIDIAGALLLLSLFGESLNIMSAIGIIVMMGIIINDSILKIDTINRLRRQEGMGLIDAIHEGGNRRLRPIIMTSLTTILALVPVFFGHSMGVELQRPLALAIIGGLGIGTLVSLYFIPLVYWFIYRSAEKKQIAS